VQLIVIEVFFEDKKPRVDSGFYRKDNLSAEKRKIQQIIEVRKSATI